MRRSTWMFIVGGLLVTLGLAFFVGPLASGDPDGLERVSIDEGFDGTAEEHDLADDTPFADYGLKGVEDEGLATGLAGIVGVVVTFGIALLLFAFLRRKTEAGEASATAGDAAASSSGTAGEADGAAPEDG